MANPNVLRWPGARADLAAGPWLILAALAGACLPLGACISGSLATKTGPNGPNGWSTDNRQQAHVGEAVEYSFILTKPFHKRPIAPYGFADYCVATIGQDRVECEADSGGRFRFEHRLTRARAGEDIKVRVTAYRQYGQRDFMEIGDTWLRGDSPYDAPDSKFATDSLTLEIYQATVEIRVCERAEPLDFDRATLELVKSGGQVTTIRRRRPGRPGFEVSGPDGQGCYTVLYQPVGSELNSAGTTEVRLSVYDRAGHPHTESTELATP
jgi:hypothetical protein